MEQVTGSAARRTSANLYFIITLSNYHISTLLIGWCLPGAQVAEPAACSISVVYSIITLSNYHISTLLIGFFHLVQQIFQLLNMLPIHFVREPAVEEIAAYSDHRTHGYKEYKKTVVGDSGGNRHL
jgi:hypothetical protein